MATVTICSDFGAQENKISHFPLFSHLPWSDCTGCHDLSFLNVEFFVFCFFKFYFIFKLYNIVLVLPNIEMNPPQVPAFPILNPPPSFLPYPPSWMLSFKSAFSLSSLTYIKRLLSSCSLSAISGGVIWGYWYFFQSWFQLVLHPVWHFTLCTLPIN